MTRDETRSPSDPGGAGGERGQPSAEDHGTADIDTVASRFAELARLLEAEDDTTAMLDDVAAAAVRIIPGTQEASVSSVVDRREVRSEHQTSALPARVDAIQTEVGEGPCLSAIYDQQTVRVRDMRHEQRWPRFARRAAEAGAGSMMSFQLFVDGDNLGSLNLYSHEVDAFDDESEQIGLLFASHASVAYADAKRIDGLHQAVASRDLIGQAKGILMERYQISADRAFQVLSRVSQTSHTRLRDVAAELVTTGRLSQLGTVARSPDH